MGKLIFPSQTLVEVVGNVASGKTTLSKKLPQLTNLSYQDTDLFENNPFLIPSVTDPKRWVFIEELYFYYLRSKKIPEVVKALKKSPLVLDQGFHMPSYMYTDNRLRQKQMTRDEWIFLRELFGHLTKDAPIPDIVIFLDIPTTILSKRMDVRGREKEREHEKLYTDEYLSQLNIGLIEYIETMKKNKNCKSVIIFNYNKKSFKTVGEPQKELIDILKLLVL